MLQTSKATPNVSEFVYLCNICCIGQCITSEKEKSSPLPVLLMCPGLSYQLHSHQAVITGLGVSPPCTFLTYTLTALCPTHIFLFMPACSPVILIRGLYILGKGATCQRRLQSFLLVLVPCFLIFVIDFLALFCHLDSFSFHRFFSRHTYLFMQFSKLLFSARKFFFLQMFFPSLPASDLL